MKRAALAIFTLLPLAGLANETPAPTLDDLDAVIQERFGNVTPDDIHQGRLGASRIARPASRRTFVPANEKERAPLTRLQGEGWSTSMYILSAGGDVVAGPIRTGKEAAAAPLDRKEVSRLGKQAIDERKALQGAQGAVRLEARPIPVSGPSCASCHDPSLKKGDPLGSVVYVLSRR